MYKNDIKQTWAIIKDTLQNKDSRIQGFKDSRIQINLFATTNTFCYGINKQDVQYNYKTNRNY